MEKEHIFLYKDKHIVLFIKDKAQPHTGYIKDIGETSIVFENKFGEQILIDLDSIKSIEPFRERKGWDNG